MKKKKLKLDQLQVQSFVTAFDKQEAATQDVRGGSSYNTYNCYSDNRTCNGGPC